MDEWGYTFTLGSAAAWFEHDSEDAQRLLRQRGRLPLPPLPTAAADRPAPGIY